jgi:ferrous iron transport protein A
MITLQQLDKLKTGKVIEIRGGNGLRNKLDGLGIRQGCIVKKISPTGFPGPIIIKIGNTQVAIGKGMAEKIIIEEINEPE